MSHVLLKKLHIKNFGPIVEDEIFFEPFTYFVGRNNAGKSHYIKAIELLLSTKSPNKEEAIKLQHNKSQKIIIEGFFEGVRNFTTLVTASNHKQAIDQAIEGETLRVVRVYDPDDSDWNFGIYKSDGTIHNPSGFTSNLLKVLPEPISIVATADTIDELKNKENTALGKLKKEVMVAFFDALRVKTKEALGGLNLFLHSEDPGLRSQELKEFEQRLKDELMAEFAHVIPTVEFGLPDEEVIAKEMKIYLDDGHKSEVEQKGHGLQRATLLALLRLLAKHGTRYRDRPRPIFLIGELESFLHPYAQKQLGEILNILVKDYQIVTTTHSPFIITPQTINGYRKVQKNVNSGTKSKALEGSDISLTAITRHLERRGNLEGLFADRIILIEGNHDEHFYHKLISIFRLPLPANQFTLFVKAGGKDELRQARSFYLQMGFVDVAVICDLDYLFSNDVRHLLNDLCLKGDDILNAFRKHIGWTKAGDPKLEEVIAGIQQKGYPDGLEEVIMKLKENRIFSLGKGSPEMYYKTDTGRKGSWTEIQSEDDLLEVDYLKTLMNEILK